jgi:hypothetical protein
MSDAINGERAGDAVKRQTAVLIGINCESSGTSFLVAEYVRILPLASRALR